MGCGGGAGWRPAPCPNCAEQRYPGSVAPGEEQIEPDTEVSAEEAERFVANVEKELRRFWIRRERAGWLQTNFITFDTESLAAETEKDAMDYLRRVTKQARRFEGLKLDAALARKLKLLKLAATLPPPGDPAKTAELAAIATWLQSAYGKAKYCPKPDGALRRALGKDKGNAEALACAPGKGGVSLDVLVKLLATSRDEEALREAWIGWHGISPPMREKYARYVELGNDGAKQLGFGDVGELWRSGYDMSPAQFRAEADRLYAEVRPFYEELHCYVRARLREQYGAKLVGEKAPIPAHLLGNMWSQSWGNVYPLVEPFKGQGDVDATASLVKQKYDELKMARLGEAFFTSLGLDPLPQTFWERSLFKKPRDREVVCHASAWDVTYSDDLRIKMCIEMTDEDLGTIHHELGHNYYFHYYRDQPVLFQQGANDGFHEALGDTIALSITPAYLKRIGLLDKLPEGDKGTVNFLMKMALDKVAFLPFGKLIDEWRWDVFAGKTPAGQYNQAWWDLRTRLQGIAPPLARSEQDFDPGAKYHVPANVPYIRYFLAFFYQFQFHRALCRAIGHQGPLHTCSIYGNKQAGEKLAAMMRLGASQPWPEALAALTGESQASGSALLEYFAPLRDWLRQQIAQQSCGW
ncbi:MAG: M2 family metallopeptidase [Deltaproteobacteria bacterium]|nr:M2 family metallopeptidase [Deltaproteobacteria bacterium]